MAQVDVAGAATALLRGAVLRCGRCGARGVMQGFFRMKERCPRCGYRFKREEGFFTGVFLINFAATLVLMWLVIMGYVVWRAATDATSSLWPVLVVMLAIAVVVPIAFYPVATTFWAALDLVLRPLDPHEEAEAALHASPDGLDRR